MTEQDRIVSRIKKRLREAPSYPTNCDVCGKHAATFTKPTRVVHFDCARKKPAAAQS